MLNAGGGHRQQLQVKAEHRSALLQQRDRFLAIGRVVVNQGHLLALELVQTALLLANRLHQHISRQPVGAGERKVPLEDASVLRLAAAVARGYQRNLVAGRFFGQRKGDSGRQRLKQRGAAVLALETLIALDAARRVVHGLALFVQYLHAIDTAPGVDQLQVVGIAVGPWNAVGRIGAGSVWQAGEELLLGLRKRAYAGGRQQAGQQNIADFHGYLLGRKTAFACRVVTNRTRGCNTDKLPRYMGAAGEPKSAVMGISAERATGASSVCPPPTCVRCRAAPL